MRTNLETMGMPTGSTESPVLQQPAGGNSPAPGSLTLSSGLTLVPRKGLHGLISGLPYAAYDEDPALRHSVLNRMHVSPLYLKTSLEEGDTDSSAMVFGRVFHTLTLQPELEEATVVVVDASDRRTKIFQTEAAKHQGKDVVLRKEYEDICRMRDRFHAKAINRGLLRGSKVEASLFWDDQVVGTPCKARPDVIGSSFLIDVKTTAEMWRFQKDAERYGYHRQAAWYLDGMRATTGRSFDTFLFIAVEKKAPFDSKVFELGTKSLRLARQQNDQNLANFHACLESNEWQGYPEQIEELAP